MKVSGKITLCQRCIVMYMKLYVGQFIEQSVYMIKYQVLSGLIQDPDFDYDPNHLVGGSLCP